MTHAEFELELVEALNMLLEDERASVEMEIALASGATEYAEREALTAMGVEDIHFCAQLRSEMELAGLPVTPQINGIVFRVLGADRYDDRLRAFSQHQRVVADHARELQESNLDGPLREALEGISETHDRHSAWTDQLADAFAATRALEFGPAGQSTSALDELAPADGEAYTMTETITDTTSAPVAEPSAASEEPAAMEAEPPSAAEMAEPPVEQPLPKPRASRAAPSKAAAKPRTTATAKPKTAAKPRAAAKSSTAKPKAAPKTAADATDAPPPRRARRTPAQSESGEG